jgi:hypothetical protein
LLVKERTMSVNALRGHLSEFGAIAVKGIGRLDELLDLAESDATLPPFAKAGVKLLAHVLEGHLEHRALLGGLHQNVGGDGEQDACRKKDAAMQPKNVVRGLMSWFKRDLRRLLFCPQRLIPPPPLWVAWKIDGR